MWYENYKFNNSAYGGKIKYVTFGAGPEDGKLRSDINRKKDKNLEIKSRMIDLGSISDDTIENLFQYEDTFNGNTSVDYEWFPLSYTNGYNSNSFAKGLLDVANISIPHKPIQSVPGWNKPLPKEYYGG